MKIFIAGAKSIDDLDDVVKKKMFSIYQNGFDVLVGDCYGVDTSVQKFYANLGYNKVIVYASNGKARNNVGNWSIKAVSVPNSAKGFEFYKQKDIAMANEADYGLMIWDGKSRGTRSNIVNLIAQSKTVAVYMTEQHKLVVVKTESDLESLDSAFSTLKQVSTLPEQISLLV